MNTRILGTVGDSLKIEGRIYRVTKKVVFDKAKGRTGRSTVFYSNLVKQVRAENGKTFSHVWVVTKEPLVQEKDYGKKILIEGRVSIYTTQSSAGTTLENARLLKFIK